MPFFCIFPSILKYVFSSMEIVTRRLSKPHEKVSSVLPLCCLRTGWGLQTTLLPLV